MAKKATIPKDILREAQDLLQRGEHLQAYKLSRKTVSAGTAPPRLFLIHAVAAHYGGKTEDAIKALRKAVRRWPDFSDALFNLGYILITTGRSGEALEPLEQLVHIDPLHVSAQSSLAMAYYETGRSEDALKACLKAIELHGETRNAAELYNLLGTLYRDKENNDLSETAFRKAMDLAPDDANAFANLAMMLEESSQLDAAEATCSQGIKLFETDFRFPLVLAKCNRRKGNARKAIELLDSVDTKSISLPAQAQVQYELGRSHDRDGATDSAFQNFADANGILARTEARNFRKTFYPKILGATSTYYLENGFTQHSVEIPASDPQPVFLIGFPRSGTTLLELTLAGHPDIAVMEEPPLVQELYTEIIKSGQPYPLALERLAPDKIWSLRSEYFHKSSRYTEDGDRKVLLNKHPLDTVFLPLILSVFPDAKIIFAARHPIDVCLSCWMQEFHLNESNVNFLDLDDTALFYAACMDIWMHFENNTKMDYTRVSYEDIVENHEETARKAVNFLQLPWFDSALDHVGSAKNLPRVNTASYHQVAEPIYARSKNRWEKYRSHLQPIIPKLRKYVEHFGYGI